MAGAAGGVSIGCMTALTQAERPAAMHSERGRDPAHTFYEHAAGLLASAQSLEAAAQEPEALTATPATLACMETTLAALASTAGRLRRHLLERLSDPVLCDEDLRPQRAEIAQRLERLAGVLDQGSFACGHVRASIEPVEDELRAV
jgi:hypothetical protein